MYGNTLYIISNRIDDRFKEKILKPSVFSSHSVCVCFFTPFIDIFPLNNSSTFLGSSYRSQFLTE